ncbi:MAG: serine/threonine protein kinase [Gemmatimonadetes bacterium]|nr:serine/threonine protein kinase [Gemmatimonadota bacterium]MCC6770378.1 serine/threonine protein kinase [Gemmatimonadaceae bacterium]
MTSLSDAAVRQLQATLELPDPGDRYEVREAIGRGGMGIVYLAFDHALGREVALKVVTGAGDSADLAARLSREAQVLARLEHPGIVAIYDVGVLADGRPFYVMRRVRGETFAHGAASRGRGEQLRLFLQVCDAVAFAHARGVIHRDITPRNVMVGEFGEVLVLDWGVARLMDAPRAVPTDPLPAPDAHAESSVSSIDRPATAPGAARTGDGVVIGTPGFMPPEQAGGAAREADQRADVFGLGATLRDVLSANGTALPRPLAAIIRRATEGLPADRYPSATALAADVRRWLDGVPVEAYRENVFERAARLYARNRPLVLLLFAYAVVRVIVLWWRGI